MLGLVLVSSMVFAQGQGEDTGTRSPETGQAVQAGGEGTPEPMLISAQTQARAQTTEQLRQMMQERQQQMNQEMQSLGEGAKSMMQNQNKVRLAVHSLQAMENMVGGIGPQVSEVARNFDNSVQATIGAENKVNTRSALKRFFAGGDEEAAEEIEGQVNQNRQRIEQLKQLREQCQCGEEVKAMMQEQIQNMEQEQTRLQQLAQNEKKSKGMFGWLWK